MIVIYLDYSATTFPNSKVLKTFNKACKKYHGNPNSSHYLGVKAKKEISDATLNIANILGIKDYEIIYTSGASEANNLAIKGLCKANKGKHLTLEDRINILNDLIKGKSLNEIANN